MKPYIGLMSGTSMDGIDAVIVDNTSNALIASLTRPYSESLKEALLEVSSKQDNDNPLANKSLGYYSQLNTLIGREFAEATLELLANSSLSAEDIIAIGSHGQTLCHDSTAEIPYTVQLGCAHTIAEWTGIRVVADFRTRDLVVGGQGAPFAPLYHQALFRGKELPLAVINIGGIANMTYLPNIDDVYGFDTGPGNCLMDAWIRKHRGFYYDTTGDWAQSGKVIPELLDSLMQDAYFKKNPPKSLGKEYFSLGWLLSHLKASYKVEDVQATLLQLTAQSIAGTIQSLPLFPTKVLICGGGVYNQALLTVLASLLPGAQIISTAVYSIHPDFVEAQMMAWLAEKTILNTALNLSKITGAKSSTILGIIYPPGIDKRIRLEL